MAILKDLTTTVIVNGKALAEYRPRDDDTKDSASTLTRYIEVTAGAHFALEFAVKTRMRANNKAIVFAASVDEVAVESTMLYTHDTGQLCGITALEKGGWTLRRFKFSDILLDDGISSKDSQFPAERLANLGVITVNVYRVDSVAEPQPSSRSFAAVKVPTPRPPVPEKLLKGRAISHQTSFDKPVESLPVVTRNCRYLDKSPFVTFHFKYRSRKALQAELIIPRSPSPIPLEDRRVETLTREEMMELLARRPVPIKPETKVLQEPAPTARKKRKLDPEADEILASAHIRDPVQKQEQIEVIDLLDD